MIKAYLAAFPSPYEGEDIEVRYSLFQDDVRVKREERFLEYAKPSVVGQISVLTLLRELEEYKDQEIVIVINDASLYEVLKGASTTKNGDILMMAGKTRKQLSKFSQLSFVNVTKDKQGLNEWNHRLEG